MSRSPRFVLTLRSVFAFLFIVLTGNHLVADAAPQVSLTAPASAFVYEVILIDARQSTGVSKMPQPDGRPSVIIDFGDGTSTNLLASGHAYRAPGTYTITLTAKDSSGGTALTQRTIVVSDIPAATGSNVQTLSNTGNAVTNATNLQAAIDVASLHNTVEQEIVLPAGAVFAGPVYLPVPVGDKYITIRSGSLNSMPAGYRVGPGSSSFMPVITAPSSSNVAYPAVGTPVPAPLPPTHHYRFQGIHLRKDDETKRVATLMNLGTDYGGGQSGISKIPHHFIVERCWFDGGASDTSQMTNGLRIFGNAVSVMDSYFGEIRLVGTGVDAAAISLTMGQGPYAFWNNTMIATSENFNIAGGAAEAREATISNATTSSATLSQVTNLELDENIALPVGGNYNARQTTIVRSINGNNVTFDPIPVAPDNGGTALWAVTPSYIEFRGNYLYKPLKWWSRHPSWNGVTYQIKNLWETKFNRYVVVDGNVMENSWIADQAYAIALSPRNISGGETAAAVVREMQFSNNIIKNAGAGINLMSDDYGLKPTQATTDITFRNNLFQNIGENFDPVGAAHMLINLQNSANARLRRVFMIHNTHDNGMPSNSNGMITDFGESGGADESMWVNNVHQHGGYGFRSNSSITDQVGNIRRFLPPGDGSSWSRNFIVNPGSAVYPTSAVMAWASWPGQFVDYANGNFTLVAGSAGKGAALDGTDIGVDMGTLSYMTRGAVSGVWDGSQPAPTPTPTNPTPTPTPTPTPIPTPTPVPTPTSTLSVQLTSPTTTTTYAYGTNPSFAAAASNSAGIVSSVTFSANSVVIGTSTVAPYTMVWTNPAAGTYSLTATARDSIGGAATSSPVSVKISKALKSVRNGRRNASTIESSISSSASSHSTQSIASAAIDSLVLEIDQAYLEFSVEQSMFSSAPDIDRYLFAALALAKSSAGLANQQSTPTSAIVDRIKKLNSYLAFCEDLMVAGAISQLSLSDASKVGAKVSVAISHPDVFGNSVNIVPNGSARVVAVGNSPMSSVTEFASSGSQYELGGVSVTVGGRAVQLISVSPASISFIVPGDLPGGIAEVVVTSRDGYVCYTSASISGLNPTIFGKSGEGSGAIFDAFGGRRETFSPFVSQWFDFGAPKLMIFATGLSSGLTNANPTNDIVLGNGQVIENLAESVVVEARAPDGRVFNLQVEFAGSRGLLRGLDQVNVVLPLELTGAGNVQITVIAGGKRSNTAVIPVN